jgi:hypothetical protein
MVATKRKKTWSQTITPHLKRYKAETSKVLKAHRDEVKRKNIKTVADSNKLWRTKYKAKFDAIDKKQDREYTKVWNAFHKQNK